MQIDNNLRKRDDIVIVIQRSVINRIEFTVQRFLDVMDEVITV